MVDSALQIFNTLVRQHPEVPLHRYQLARALLKKGDKNRARIELSYALQKKPVATEEGKIKELLAHIQ
jgi:predicted Zn-dependent protease